MYHQCSLVNHECNPNMARFDDFEAAAGLASGGRSPAALTGQMTFRAIHDLPQGEWGLLGFGMPCIYWVLR